MTRRHLSYALIAGLIACSDSPSQAEREPADEAPRLEATEATEATEAHEASASTAGLRPTDFHEASLIAYSTEPCVLSGGTETECHRVTVRPRPSDHDIGPFCPRLASDGPEVSGQWFVDGALQDADGAFLRSLPEVYDDDGWNLFDGERVKVTDTQEACEAAARPDVDARYQNHCVECDAGYYEVTPVTYWLPVSPVTPGGSTGAPRGRQSAFGVALNGVGFDPPAPVDAILGAHTLAPLDDCGGHVNPHTGYHYHAAAGCSTKVDASDGHSALVGYAMDGHGIYAQLEDRDGLDECGGHSDAIRGYHYHVGPAGGNQVLGCVRGETGCSASGAEESDRCDATQTRGGPPDGPPGGATGMGPREAGEPGSGRPALPAEEHHDHPRE